MTQWHSQESREVCLIHFNKMQEMCQQSSAHECHLTIIQPNMILRTLSNKSMQLCINSSNENDSMLQYCQLFQHTIWRSTLSHLSRDSQSNLDEEIENIGKNGNSRNENINANEANTNFIMRLRDQSQLLRRKVPMNHIRAERMANFTLREKINNLDQNQDFSQVNEPDTLRSYQNDRIQLPQIGNRRKIKQKPIMQNNISKLSNSRSSSLEIKKHIKREFAQRQVQPVYTKNNINTQRRNDSNLNPIPTNRSFKLHL
ncbi:UNKNOWN [Stylonychia lemnae]|uniref:Uncharacterized protein n=1 Tax=Stylonychia lemnae TaxID=5949 RepID=A0A078B1G9_STYLE|nr:UNKNOWN [Stylonychia lemnae]|eukprot:CDW87078.1 UNKNOWN [Stylonychia lemnae]